MYCEERLHLLSTGLLKMIQTEQESNGSDQFLAWFDHTDQEEQSEDEARENTSPGQTAPTKLDSNTISA